MKNKRLISILIILCLALTLTLSACNINFTAPRLEATFDNSHTVYVGDTLDSLRPYLTVTYYNNFSMAYVIEHYTLQGTLTEGECTIDVVHVDLSASITVTVLPKDATGGDDVGGNIGGENNNKDKDDTDDNDKNDDNDNDKDKDDNGGGSDNDFTTDPYVNMTSTEFYRNYTPAKCYMDAYWRTQHNFMSGSIADQDQAPTLADNQPKSGSNLIRNSDSNYIDNGNTWEVVDSTGNVVNKIYKGGAYVTLEEVAAYVYAFGDIPANYVESNSTSQLSGNPWGKYLRLNHSRYSNNNTGNYAYEPKLPETGPGGKMQYYEIDIGTTGTNAGGYTPSPYNTGSKITRGAARIVYTRYYANGKLVDDLEYRYVFYTYNHYNDFQEYLNYQGGWGTMFGNISNGGTYNQGSNPSPYVAVTRTSFTSPVGQAMLSSGTSKYLYQL